MAAETRNTDKKARVSLPKSFANSTVVIEQVSPTEVRIRKARVIPEDELPLEAAAGPVLSDRDRDLFLTLLDSPPEANEALRNAAGRYRKRHGKLAH